MEKASRGRTRAVVSLGLISLDIAAQLFLSSCGNPQLTSLPPTPIESSGITVDQKTRLIQLRTSFLNADRNKQIEYFTNEAFQSQSSAPPERKNFNEVMESTLGIKSSDIKGLDLEKQAITYEIGDVSHVSYSFINDTDGKTIIMDFSSVDGGQTWSQTWFINGRATVSSDGLHIESPSVGRYLSTTSPEDFTNTFGGFITPSVKDGQLTQSFLLINPIEKDSNGVVVASTDPLAVIVGKDGGLDYLDVEQSNSIVNRLKGQPVEQSFTPLPPTQENLPPTSIPPTEVPPTSTPDALANVDLRNPSTFPAEIQSYWATAQYPDVATQESNTKIFTGMYTKLLNQYADKYGISQEQIKQWSENPNMLAFRAGEIALKEGFYLPMDPAITRNMDTGLQAVSYRDDQHNLHFGISAGTLNNSEIAKTMSDYVLFSQNYNLNVFGQESNFKRLPTEKVVASEVFPVQWSDGRYGIILHYTDDNGQDCFLPLRVYFDNNGEISQFLNANGSDYFTQSIEPPKASAILGSDFIGNNNYTPDSLLADLQNADFIQAITYYGDPVNPISEEGLETASVIFITKKSAQSP